jgi:hypothetical protein
MDVVTREAGARFLLLLHPDEPAIVRPSRLSTTLREASPLSGIPILDLGARYRARGLGPDELLIDYQGHLSALGHRIAAQEIETWLASLDEVGS